MARVKHAVINTDNMRYCDLVSVKVKERNTEKALSIDNGNIVRVGGLVQNEREIRHATPPLTTDSFNDLAVIATPEVMYDERLNVLEDFYNEEGNVCRGYRFRNNAEFSVTKEALIPISGNELNGTYVGIKDGETKIVVSPTAEAEGFNCFGVIIENGWHLDGRVFVTIRITDEHYVTEFEA
jgi:hypothetical protein